MITIFYLQLLLAVKGPKLLHVNNLMHFLHTLKS
jgi:hypothetical protein